MDRYDDACDDDDDDARESARASRALDGAIEGLATEGLVFYLKKFKQSEDWGGR